MSFLQPSDFTGVNSQSTNTYTEDPLQLYIDKYEPIYLQSLLGCDMYDDFVADLLPTPAVTTSVPQDVKFLALFNPFCIDDTYMSGCQHRSEGIKEMLKYFIFWEYARDNQEQFAITGSTKNAFSNSELVSLSHTKLYRNYNLGIETYKAVQWYICDNPNDYDYDNYNGIDKQFTDWL